MNDAPTKTMDRFYINGRWVPPIAGGRIEVIDSVTEKVMATVPSGSADDADAAVDAARTAFDKWATLPVADRARCVSRIGDALASRLDELADWITRETGMPLPLSRSMQVQLPIDRFHQAAEVAEHYVYEERVANSSVVREPAGVVACITPWNLPLNQITAKAAFALVAGCTVVVKPSEISPVDAFILAEAVDEVGLPAGVFNLISGTGPIVGEALVSHPDVDMVSFTGSTQTGARVLQLAAPTIKRVALELGGKSASILLDDLDEPGFSHAISESVHKAFINSGQMCTALSRLLVPVERLKEAERVAAHAATVLVVGDPFTEGVDLGPLASAAQRDRVQDYIQKGLDEGGTLIAGGLGAPDGLDRGYYVRPTIFSRMTSTMTVAQEEIFGPVLALLPYDDEDDAIRIANGVVYGLAGAVWSADPTRANAVARRLRTGRVEINGGAYNMHAPFGGYKQSGIGREYGRHGLEEFLEIKNIQA